MNNDISSEFTKYINSRPAYSARQAADVSVPKVADEQPSKSYEAASDYYTSLGHAKINMDKSINNRITDSIDMLKKDPEYVQSYIDFCDFLQQQGYSAEDAVIGADIIFEKLKDESTYKP